jgi:hypothetical protein
MGKRSELHSVKFEVCFNFCGLDTAVTFEQKRVWILQKRSETRYRDGLNLWYTSRKRPRIEFTGVTTNCTPRSKRGQMLAPVFANESKHTDSERRPRHTHKQPAWRQWLAGICCLSGCQPDSTSAFDGGGEQEGIAGYTSLSRVELERFAVLFGEPWIDSRRGRNNALIHTHDDDVVGIVKVRVKPTDHFNAACRITGMY